MLIPAPSIQTIHTLTNRFMEMTPTITPTTKRKMTMIVVTANGMLNPHTTALMVMRMKKMSITVQKMKMMRTTSITALKTKKMQTMSITALKTKIMRTMIL